MAVIQTYNKVKETFPDGGIHRFSCGRGRRCTRRRGCGRYREPGCSRRRPPTRSSRLRRSTTATMTPVAEIGIPTPGARCGDRVGECAGRGPQRTRAGHRRERPGQSQPTSPGTLRPRVDFREQLDSRLPWIFAFVFGLAFILMTAHVPLDRDLAERDRAESVVRGSRIRRACARLPGRSRRRPARIRLERRGSLLVASIPVRDLVRALDGLPRVHPLAGSRRPTTEG